MYKDFINHYPSVVDRMACNSAVAVLESQRFQGSLENRERQVGKGNSHIVADEACDIGNAGLTFVDNDLGMTFDCFRDNLPNLIEEKVEDYIDEYSMARGHNGTLMNLSYKMQMTRVGESYSAWHSEWGISASNRYLVWMLYLNDIMEGGETEWLYYNRRIRPKAGDLVIWPAGFTHAHRGNPPLDKKKYVITGWITVH